MYTAHKIDTLLKLPYNLIEIKTINEHFILKLYSFDDQSDYSIKMGGVTGKIGVNYLSSDINCDFMCDITIGNVYAFYLQLDNAYDILLGKNCVAVLESYDGNHTKLAFTFDKQGHCVVEGNFKNENYHYKNGITFSFEIDQTYITDILKSLGIFFDELRRIQGHNNFY